MRLHVGLELVAGHQDQQPHDLGQYLTEQQPPPGPLRHGQRLHAVACAGATTTETYEEIPMSPQGCLPANIGSALRLYRRICCAGP